MGKCGLILGMRLVWSEHGCVCEEQLVWTHPEFPDHSLVIAASGGGVRGRVREVGVETDVQVYG